MPKFINRFHGLHLILIIILCIALILITAFYSKFIAILGVIVLIILIYITYRIELIFRQEFNSYTRMIHFKVKKIGKDVIENSNIGIILYDEFENIEWYNSYIKKINGSENLIGKKITDVFPNININKEIDNFVIEQGPISYQINLNYNERLLYITDITAYSSLLIKYNNEKTVLGIIHFDNLVEISKEMDELSKGLLLTDVTSRINDWGDLLDIYIKKISTDKFLFITNTIGLSKLEETNIDIIDKVRDVTKTNKIPMTLSIGIGAGADSLVKIGEFAQTSLDIALGRGGDQAVVKVNEKLTFYGGKSDAVEKRTRVRARVISHALRDLIQESDFVIIMGHKSLDMDAIGSAIGVLKAVHLNGKDGKVIIEKTNPMIKNLLDEINKTEKYSQDFTISEQVISKITTKTLLVVVDTHRQSLTIDPNLIDRTNRIVIIDHHRRGKEIIENSLLNYIEPYASSASELVAEILQYQTDKLELSSIESTAMLSGIVVDTGSFTYRTGYRTFEAASFLRSNGADPILVQKVLKEDLEVFIKRAELMKKTKKVFDNIGLLVVEDTLDQVQIAQLADTLLEMSGVLASFVISRRDDDLISISARSLGEINVQVIMELLGGGGHLSNASTQLDGITLAEVEEKLMNILGNIQTEED